MRRKGFTLIELLIVVLIIAILAAIAVPNFLEFQTRAKVARVKSDIRNLVTAIEALQVDYGANLIDFWDDDRPEGIERLHNVFGRTEQDNNRRKGTIGVLAPLTTPIAYLSSIPQDPFVEPDYSRIRNGQLSNSPWTYCFIDNDSGIDGVEAPASFSTLVRDEYVLFSPGPFRLVLTNETVTDFNHLLYDPTNGTLSIGMIIYSSRTNFDARTSH